MDFEELIVKQMATDKELMGLLVGKISDALSSLDLGEIVATQVQQTIEAVFENDQVYDMLEDSLKAEIGKTINKHFKK